MTTLDDFTHKLTLEDLDFIEQALYKYADFFSENGDEEKRDKANLIGRYFSALYLYTEKTGIPFYVTANYERL